MTAPVISTYNIDLCLLLKPYQVHLPTSKLAVSKICTYNQRSFSIDNHIHQS